MFRNLSILVIIAVSMQNSLQNTIPLEECDAVRDAHRACKTSQVIRPNTNIGDSLSPRTKPSDQIIYDPNGNEVQNLKTLPGNDLAADRVVMIAHFNPEDPTLSPRAIIKTVIADDSHPRPVHIDNRNLLANTRRESLDYLFIKGEQSLLPDAWKRHLQNKMVLKKNKRPGRGPKPPKSTTKPRPPTDKPDKPDESREPQNNWNFEINPQINFSVEKETDSGEPLLLGYIIPYKQLLG